MGSLLLAAGTAGMRHSLPNARVMIHQPSGGARVTRTHTDQVWVKCVGWGKSLKIVSLSTAASAGSGHGHRNPG